MRSTTPSSTVRVPPPASSLAGSPGNRKKRKNRNDSARKTVGTSSAMRRTRELTTAHPLPAGGGALSRPSLGSGRSERLVVNGERLVGDDPVGALVELRRDVGAEDVVAGLVQERHRAGVVVEEHPL